jgi:hypothetical protein
MNKADLLVKRMLMEWPSIYQNRFQAMIEILTSGHFSWVDGCIEPDKFYFSHTSSEQKLTPITFYEQSLKKTKERIKEYKNVKYLKSLNDSRLAEAKFDLIKAKFLEQNIDIFASEFCGIESNEIDCWLLKLDKNWFYEPHACICKMPAEIDSDWDDAIRSFLLEVMSNVNGLFAIQREHENVPIPEHKKIYNFFKKLFKRFAR